MRPHEGLRVRGWASLLLVSLSLVVLVAAGASEGGAGVVLALALALVVAPAAAYSSLAHRGRMRSRALVALVAALGLVCWLLGRVGLLVPALVSIGLLGLGLALARSALTGSMPTAPAAMPETAAPPVRHAFIVMNPRAGAGKVGRWRLAERAEAMGAEVVVLDPSADAAALARDAVARGADLLGVAGGDGTQARLAGVAAEADVPLMVICAGTHNHFALDLGLDRDDPVACLAALGEDAVELRVDLGVVGDRHFVNSVSFGAYAAAVGTPTYRHGKVRALLGVVPQLLRPGAAPTLTARGDGVVAEQVQAVLVSDNPYGPRNPAGPHRPRLDSGRLGLVAVRVHHARQAFRLWRRSGRHRWLTVAEVPEVVVTADVERLPVAIDGEAVTMTPPVTCRLRPRALRVRVPRQRPGAATRSPGRPRTSLRGSTRGGKEG